MSKHDRDSTKRLIAAFGCSILGGVVIFLGWAGFGLWPLELVALVPFWASVELVRHRSWKAVLAVTWLYGTIGNAGGYHWLVEFFQVFAGLGLPSSVGVFALFAAYLGAQYGMMGLLYWAMRQRRSSVATAALAAFILSEWLYPKLFPVYLSNTLLAQPILVQTAELGGPLLASFFIGVVNVAVFESARWLVGVRGRPIAVWATAVAFVGFTLVYGAIRIDQVDARAAVAPSFEVGVVQANMGIFEKRRQPEESHRRHLEQSLELEREGPVDLLIWPESAYGPKLPRTLPFDAPEIRDGLTAPLLFGGLSQTYEGERRMLYNTVFLLDASGTIRATYDKTFLLMFGEYLPFGDTFPILYELSPNSGRFVAGTHVEPIGLGPWRLSTPVCYEDVLPGFTREMVLQGNPHLLVNLTNDAWFGDTQEPAIHLALAQFRAIEHRRYFVRATNSGVSAVIDPVGRIIARTGVQTRETLRATVHMLEGKTVYARLGDWPGWASLLVTLVALLRRR